MKKYETSAKYPPDKPGGLDQLTEGTTKSQEKGATPNPSRSEGVTGIIQTDTHDECTKMI